MDQSLPVSNGLRGPLRKRDSSLWARHPEDWYVEPPWVSERLFQSETFRGSIHDPAAGKGNILLSAFGWAEGRVSGSDLVDRIDNNRNYEPGNCRWATRKEQARNKRHET